MFNYESEFANFDYVIIAGGVNDLARYDHTPLSLAESVIPRLEVTCAKHRTTVFLYSSILETKHSWLNGWIGEFNWAMFKVAAKVPNLFFFDAHDALERDHISDPSNDQTIYRPGDDVHITDAARRVVANELVLSISLLVNLELARIDKARAQLTSWDWPLRPSFVKRRNCFMKEFHNAIPSL
jgi:lysophospholipase L1-like esterase